MVRKLLWLENNSFAAWGCAACNWILPNVRATPSGQPSTAVREAFDKHDCAKFTLPSSKENRPSRSRRP